MGDTSSFTLAESQDFVELAANLNRGNAQHAHEVRSFAQAYDAELRGAVDGCGDIIMDIVSDMAAKESITSPPQGSNDWKKWRGRWCNVIYFGIKKGKLQHSLRSVHIEASLHAAFRWDKKRRFEANDIYDFHHAVGALAYCRAFFTEGSLQSVVTANHLALDKLYNCYVFADISEATSYLRTLSSKAA